MVSGFSTLVLLCCLLGTDAENYAVLVAGSRGFWNYRHQADVAHAFHALRRRGMNSENIITFLYDDVASDPLNPFPNQLFNHPTGAQSPGINVYDGLRKSYVGEDVTAENFLNVITGNASAMAGIGSGQVLTSGPDDHVFIYYTDHGGTGVVEMPAGPMLLASDLIDALMLMYKKNMYSRLVFYLEACESGSMFNGLLPPGIRVYATTASTPNEASMAAYCPPDDYIDGIAIGTCLGDMYSVAWIENTDNSPANETLFGQFRDVHDKTNTSHVSRYGDVTWLDELMIDFEGGGINIIEPNLTHTYITTTSNTNHYQRDGYLIGLLWRLKRAPNFNEIPLLKQDIQSYRKREDYIDTFWTALIHRLAPNNASFATFLLTHSPSPSEIDKCQRNNCCRSTYEAARKCNAFNLWTDHGLRHTRTIVNLCQHTPSFSNLFCRN